MDALLLEYFGNVQLIEQTQNKRENQDVIYISRLKSLMFYDNKYLIIRARVTNSQPVPKQVDMETLFYNHHILSVQTKTIEETSFGTIDEYERIPTYKPPPPTRRSTNSTVELIKREKNGPYTRYEPNTVPVTFDAYLSHEQDDEAPVRISLYKALHSYRCLVVFR